ARHELHHDEEHVLLLFRREDRDDVRMIEACQEARLAQQLAEIDALLVRDLQRDFLVDPGVFRQVDGAEPAAANRLENLVLADNLTAEEHPRRSIAPAIRARWPTRTEVLRSRGARKVRLHSTP